MEPQTTPSPELPPPITPGEQTSPDSGQETLAPTPERVAPKGETASQSAPILPPPVLPQPVADAADSPADGSQTPAASDQSVGPPVADDVDVIEKEWVDKAKSIVNEHKHDPYNQEKETSRLQADYLKKRYGKDIKLSP